MTSHRHGALDAALAFLRCPHCARALERLDGVLRCAAGHSYDIARQGYVNLRAARAKATGDDAAMLDARARFLGAGHFDAVRDAVVARVTDSAADVPGCLADAGAGTGWHLAAALDGLPERAGIALDASAAALRRAAAAHPRMAAVGCDVWEALPLGTDVAAVVLVVFAPRNAVELARVLHPDGALVVVTPTERHLAEAREPLGLLDVQSGKAEALDAALSPHFALERETMVEQRMALTRDDALALAAMGPSSRHAAPGDFAARLADVPEPWPVTASVRISAHRPR